VEIFPKDGNIVLVVIFELDLATRLMGKLFQFLRNQNKPLSLVAVDYL